MATQPIFGTLGTFRFMLALSVMAGHLWLENTPVSNQAVMLFYMVSGYVVSISLDNRYLYSRAGIKNFYINRCLRIYPLYFVALVVTVLGMFIFPEIKETVDSRMFMLSPERRQFVTNWLANITLMDTTSYTGKLLKPQVIPAAWTVGVEMVYWIFMPLLLLCKPLRHLLFVAAIAHMAYYIALDISTYPDVKTYSIRYYGFTGGVLPFLMGMYIYDANKRRLPCLPHLAMPFIVAAYKIFYNYGILIMHI